MPSAILAQEGPVLQIPFNNKLSPIAGITTISFQLVRLLALPAIINRWDILAWMKAGVILGFFDAQFFANRIPDRFDIWRKVEIDGRS